MAALQQQQPLGGIQGGTFQRLFPPAFNLYRRSAVFSGGRTYFIGEHGDQPIYAVSMHTGWSGKPDVIIHNGPTSDAPELASYDQKTMSRGATVSLGGAVEEVEGHWGGGARSFSVDVGGGRREAFEWRRSTGEAVRGLGGSSHGRKLVRLAAGGGGSGPVAGDGGEVVAVCTPSRWTGKKMMIFQFVGSGAMGVLGETWALMAVVTAVGIFERDQRNKQAAAAAA